MICKVPPNPGYSVSLTAQGFCRDVNGTKVCSLPISSVTRRAGNYCAPPWGGYDPCFCPQETGCKAVPATEYQCQVGGLGFLPSLRS